ncbi:VOC family protein [Micromonospora sp. WMMC415]|nr:VOC family protein [Micromonospora sp. WMMC415]
MTMKTHMPSEVARFWRDLLGYRLAPNHSNSVLLVSDDAPALLIQPSVEQVEPGAIHLDLRPENQAACVARAVQLGAAHVGIGQTGDEGWVVMVDPGGNLFCVLQSRADYLRSLAEDPGTPTRVG